MILIWTTSSAIGNACAKETLDLALAFASFDQPVALLATDLAVNQFCSKPNAKIAGSKDLSKLIKSLPIFDIDRIYLCEKSAAKYSVSAQDLVVDAQFVTSEKIAELLAEASRVIKI